MPLGIRINGHIVEQHCVYLGDQHHNPLNHAVPLKNMDSSVANKSAVIIEHRRRLASDTRHAEE